MSTPTQNDLFLQELEKLNPAQAAAVEAIEGPVLVIAGPGTGKTQILAARIGNILLKTDTRPHNILCLTYTDAGTIAMRRRLLRFIGPDAYRVHIHTFHSFCNTVIQENLDYFGLRALEPVSELEKIEVLREIIDAFGNEHPLKRWTGDIYYETGRLDRLFQIMKREDWDPDFLHGKIKEYLEDIPYREEFTYKKSGKDYKAGDLKTKAIEDEKTKMAQLAAAADAFTLYTKKLAERNRYDYADMILWVIDAFRKNEYLLRRYQEQYLYYLVDEFQDTSGAQGEVLQLLIHFWDNPNVFVVGDDDQSIYAFQDANLRNILEFANRYPDDLKTVMMTENYRSTQAVLDLAGSLISNNRERLVNEIRGLDKTLMAANPEMQQTSALPEIRAYFNYVHETVHISQEIEQMFREGKNLAEVAVIYRNHRQAEDMATYLQHKGVPISIRKKADVLTDPLILRIITILRYIQAEITRPHSGENLLFGLMHFDFFGLSSVDIAKLSIDISRKNYGERKTSFREEIARVKGPKPTLFDPEPEIPAFKHFSNDVEYWIKESANLTLQQLAEKIINRGGILSRALNDDNKYWNMQLINTFFDFIKDECARDTRLNLKGFLEKVDLMHQNNVELPIEKSVYAANGVQFLTAHSSKGLEFDTVYLIGCDAGSWDKSGRSGTYALPDTLRMHNEVDDSEEARRLFYVALTRAKKHLYVSFPENGKNEKSLEKSRFVAEIEAGTALKPVFIALPDEALLEFTATVLDEGQKPVTALVDQEYLDQLLEKYTMSVTHLSNYLKCPLSFYFQQLIRVPQAKSPSATFGSAVHYGLEKLYLQMLASEPKAFPPATQLVKDFEWYMWRNEDSFTPAEYRLRLEYGRKILTAYYEKYADSWNKVAVSERRFRNVEMGGIPITGAIDKIDFTGNEATLTDYKTGQYTNAREKFKRPDPEKVTRAEAESKEPKFEDLHGGDYWRQAVFYRILMDEDQSKPWKMVAAEFDFVEPDKKTQEFHKEKVIISPEDISVIKGQIRNTYKQIKMHNFSGCGKKDCEWCSFVKNQLQ